MLYLVLDSAVKSQDIIKDVIDWMNLQDAEKVAVDIPSGICAATGKILGTAFPADLTVCMACVKLGCELFPGKSYAGESISRLRLELIRNIFRIAWMFVIPLTKMILENFFLRE